MNNKIHKRIKTVVIVLVCLIVAAVLVHLAVNYLVPLFANMHHMH